jgi:thiamine-phosphate pyrophosphorylase
MQTTTNNSIPRITGGLYLVIDPSPGAAFVLPKVRAALRGGASVLQIWNRGLSGFDAVRFVQVVCACAAPFGVPVLINANLDLLKASGAHGLHLYDLTHTPAEVRVRAGRPVITGCTCGNDLDRVRNAVDLGVDYISFCSMYPSLSVNTCDLVSLETVRQARAIAACPIFASGGVTPENTTPLLESGADGIAVISGILSADDPESAARAYLRVLDTFKT